MFIPKRIIFEKDALEYEIAKGILTKFKDKTNIEIINLTSNKLKQHIPGADLFSQYREGKRTLVVGTKKSLKFQSCKNRQLIINFHWYQGVWGNVSIAI